MYEPSALNVPGMDPLTLYVFPPADNMSEKETSKVVPVGYVIEALPLPLTAPKPLSVPDDVQLFDVAVSPLEV